MKLHFPETWKISIFQYVTSGPLEFCRGVHNVRLHLEGKTFLNVMIFFEDAISWDEPVTQNVIYFLGGPQVWCSLCENRKQRQHSKQGDGGISKQPKCGWVRGKKNVSYNLPAPASPCPWSQHIYLTYSSFRMQNNDAHNSVDSVNVVPQHKTCHGVG